MDSHGLHRLLGEGDWRRSFNHRVLQHAATYACEQRVLSLTHETLDPQAESLTGAVHGSRPQPYLCALELRTQRRGMSVRTQCSCPAAEPCKHAAAMLIVAGRTPPEAWPGVNSPEIKAATATERTQAARKPPSTVRRSAHIIATTPTPVLNLRNFDAPRLARGKTNMRLACARLEFDYDGHRVAPADYEETTQLTLGKALVEIRRDQWTEESTRERMEELGFINAEFFLLTQGTSRPPLPGHDFFLRPAKRQPPLAPEDCATLLARLASDGFRIEYEDGFPREELVEISGWHAELAVAGNAWFEVSLGIDVEGERVDLLPVLGRVLADPSFPLMPQPNEPANATRRIRLDAGHSVELPLERLRALISPMLEWLQEVGTDGKLRVHASHAPALRALSERAGLVWRDGDMLRERLELLRHAPRSLDAPAGFRTTLRAYQREGLAWLRFLSESGLGGILADDMGLGKTVQVLAHIFDERQRGRLQAPALVIAPTSLIGNWRDEAARFVPDLKLLILHGSDRARHFDDIAAHDLVITTYPLLPRDRNRLLEQDFSLLVLDEAQAIKNARSQAAGVVRKLRAGRRLAMTGTPLENHLGELWAQFDAVEPGLLGSERLFARHYRTPIEKHGDEAQRERLKRRIAPLLLRRRKDDVLTELPPKIEIERRLELAPAQRSLYESLRLAQHERVRAAIRQRGLARSGIVVLDALLKLRQACCDPRLVKLDSARNMGHSAKLDALFELLDALLDEGRRILLFSQFTEMLGLIEAALVKRAIPYLLLSGQTPGARRSELIARFQAGEVPVLLASLKAGGVGLNLTAADAVIHYDPWWNPAVERQATDRAHRIGQDKPVFVYRLICSGTVEEKIHALQKRKAGLAQAILEGGGSGHPRFDENDLAELFAPL